MNIKPDKTATTRKQNIEEKLDTEVKKSPNVSKDKKSRLNPPSKFQKQQYLNTENLPNLYGLGEYGDSLMYKAEQKHGEFVMARNVAQLTEQMNDLNKEREALRDEVTTLKRQIQLSQQNSKVDPQQILELRQQISELAAQNKVSSELVQEKDRKIQCLQLKIDEFNKQQEQETKQQQILDQRVKDDYEIQIKQYKDQLDEQMEQLRRLQQDYSNNQTDHDKLTRQLQQKEQELNQLSENFNSQFKTMEAQITEKQQTILDQYQLIKQLEYQIQDLKGKIRITVRIRPATSAQRIQFTYPDKINYKKQLTYRTQGQKAADGRDRNTDVAVDFDRVFSAAELQKDIFFEFQPLISQVFDGYKICIFAYGQSGSGKTFTQYGNDQNPGIMPLSLQYIFRQIQTLQGNSISNQDNSRNYRVQVQFYEIYNDKLYDLLADQNGQNLKSSAVELKADFKAPECKVSIIKDVVKISGLNTVAVSGIDEAYDLIQISQSRRKTSSTVLNDTSSRSHAVFTINMLQDVDGAEVKGSLTIVDLAGSEQLQNTNVDPQRKQESIFINQSLSCLGKVFNNLKSGEGHVPYRDCTLTKVLQEYFQGQNKVVMIVCLNEDSDCYSESVNSLNFALRVRGVSIKK